MYTTSYHAIFSTYPQRTMVIPIYFKNISFIKLYRYILCISLVCILPTLTSFGQEQRNLAKQYATDGNFEKAETLYAQLLKQAPSDVSLYQEYLQVLLIQKKYQEALALNGKLRKKLPDDRAILVDFYSLSKQTLDKEAFTKLRTKFFKKISKDPTEVELYANTLQQKGLLVDAIDLMLASRESLSNYRLYAQRLAQSYAILSMKLPMLQEYISLLETYQLTKEEVQNSIQMELSSDSDYVALEELLINRLQERPDQTELSELLVWLYVQQKDFIKAFQLEKAQDVRYQKRGTSLLELANLSVQNNDYSATSLICKYLVNKYPTGNTYYFAKKLLIFSSEKQLKDKWPIQKDAVREVIDAYRQFATQAVGMINTDEIKLSIARLLAFYLGELDSSAQIIQEVIDNPKNPSLLLAEAKLDLGDIFLLLGDHWEASLLYSQVEKGQKEQPLGYEAKFRNARLNYFKGEFYLAQSHLDILKLATTREIANNAIALSLLIKANTELDSTEDAKMSFAHVELLEYTQSLEEALDSLKNMLAKYYSHSLADDILYKQATLLRKTGKYYEAISVLDQLNTRFPTSIYADDALFTKAQIYEFDLVLLPEAQSTYEKLLLEFRGSTLVNESRKRYRKLRGDKIN